MARSALKKVMRDDSGIEACIARSGERDCQATRQELRVSDLASAVTFAPAVIVPVAGDQPAAGAVVIRDRAEARRASIRESRRDGRRLTQASQRHRENSGEQIPSCRLIAVKLLVVAASFPKPYPGRHGASAHRPIALCQFNNTVIGAGTPSRAGLTKTKCDPSAAES
jgi:hypothetical protein